jgi:hypothetical protein
MFTTLDFLYLALGVCALILVLFLSVALIQVVLVIRDVRKITNTAGSLTEHFHNIILTPLHYLGSISEIVGPHLENFIESRLNKKKK